jgi:hypothetical protein
MTQQNDNAQSLAARLPKLPGASPEPIVGTIGVGKLGASMPSIGPTFPQANPYLAPGGWSYLMISTWSPSTI